MRPLFEPVSAAAAAGSPAARRLGLVEAPATAASRVAAEPRLARAEPRVEWVNYAKGVGILLVVFSHCIRGEAKTVASVPAQLWFADATIYLFHMPLFFFLAGLFVAKSARRPAGQFLAQKARGILYPYVLWTLLQAAAAAAFARYTNNLTSLGQVARSMAYAPYMQFWFLYVLLLCSLAYLTLNRLGIGSKGVLVVGAALYVIGARYDLGLGLDRALGLVHLGTGGATGGHGWPVLYQFQINFLYFAAGAAISRRLMAALSGAAAAAPRPALLVLIGLAGALVPILVCLNLTRPDPHGLRPLACVMAAAAGIAATVALAVVAQRRGAMRWLGYLGEASLAIYVAHVIAAAAARALLHAALGNGHVYLAIAAATAAGVLLPLALHTLACRRLRLNYLFSA